MLANAVDPHLDQTFFYVFDVPAGLFEGSLAIAHSDGQLDVLTAALESETAFEAAKKDPNVKVHVVTREDTDAEAKKILEGAGTVALNYRELTHEWFLRLDKAFDSPKWVDASNAIRRARVTKDPNEIQNLRKAGEIGSKVGRDIPSISASSAFGPYPQPSWTTRPIEWPTPWIRRPFQGDASMTWSAARWTSFAGTPGLIASSAACCARSTVSWTFFISSSRRPKWNERVMSLA